MQRALEQYLETKRHVFPRFYFISNDDLLEILANAKKPELIQPHIKKLFENIKFLSLSKVSSALVAAEAAEIFNVPNDCAVYHRENVGHRDEFQRGRGH